MSNYNAYDAIVVGGGISGLHVCADAGRKETIFFFLKKQTFLVETAGHMSLRTVPGGVLIPGSMQ